MIWLAALRFLRRLPWQVWALVAVLLVGWWQVHAYGNRRAKAAETAVYALWEVQNAKAAKVAEEAERARQVAEAADFARNQELVKAYEQDIARITTDRDRLQRLLSRAIAAASAPRGGGDSQAASIPAAPDASAASGNGSVDATAGIAAAIADALTEARENAAQLDALIAEVQGQIPR